ncbi:MAG: hypothetical protein K9J06_09880 [Flavobacteriales bacterium]|nr:hypothetical protein [Flavobacteriales bacterium]
MDGYYGIQCKGRNEYNHNQLTEKEINAEVEAAKLFEPPLKKLYLATTAQDDASVQAYVRKLNLKYKSEGLFEVHVFGWGSIVDLITANKRTHDFYLKSQNFKRNHAVQVTFLDGSATLNAAVQFSQTRTIYSTKDDPLTPFRQHWSAIDSMMSMYRREKDKVNRSYFHFGLRVENTGECALENYKLTARLSGGYQTITNEQPIKHRTAMLISAIKHMGPLSLTRFNESKGIITLNCGLSTVLVPHDTHGSDDLWIKPLHDTSEILVDWTFLSKEFNDEGQLRIEVKSEIERRRKYVKVEDPSEERKEEGAVTDYWEDLDAAET